MVRTAVQAFAGIRVEAIAPHMGVKLTEFELESAARLPEFVVLLKQLLQQHLVVFVPRQVISPATTEFLPALFGPLVNIKRAGNVAHHVPGYEWIKVISNGTAPDGIAYGDGNSSAQIWHSDSTPWEVPVGVIGFYCRQTVNPVPKTYFKNMIEVHAALPAAMKDRIEKVRVVHHFYPRQIEVKIHQEGRSMSLEDRKLGFVHPLVRRHLPSGRPILYLPTRRDSLVQGMSEAEGRELLDELWDFANAAPFDIGVGLEADDYVIWDNSATVHSRDGWDESLTRIMWHVSAEGEVPTPMSPRRSVNTIGLTPEQAREVTKRQLGMSDY